MDMADLPAVREIVQAHRHGVQADAEDQLKNAFPGARTTCTDDPGGGFTVRATSPYGDAELVFAPHDPPEGVVLLAEWFRQIHELAEGANGRTTTSSDVS